MSIIGVFGGTFDPPHNGHVKALTEFAKVLPFTQILVIPTAVPPHKAQSEISAYDRLEMSRLAFSGIKGVSIDDCEIKKGGKSYTTDTVKYLRERYPDDEFVLFLGSDMLMSLEKWYKAEELMHVCSFAVFSRTHGDIPMLEEKARYLHEKYGAKVTVYRSEPLEISSEMLREALPFDDVSDFIPPEVIKYIDEKSLYGRVSITKIDAVLRERVSEKRYRHCLGVAQTAVKLAEKYGADPIKARVAGLLHDITKNLDGSEQLIYAEENGIFIDDIERLAPQIIHAKTAAFFAENVMGIRDKDVLNAIRYHTTGRPGASLLEKIIYVSDFIEPTRDYSDVSHYRDLAEKSLDNTLFEGMKWIICDNINGNRALHPNTLDVYNEYIRIRKDKKL